MNKVLAISIITLRNAVRSRVVLVLVAALLVVTTVIPLTVKSDGTLQGELQIILRYSLGAAAMLLSLATVWAGCAAISLEIQHRRILMVAVKPIRRAQIWVGSWLGLVLLNAALLAFVGILNYGLIRWRLTQPARASEERTMAQSRLLTSRRILLAPPPDVEAEVQAAFDQMQAEGKLAPHIPAAQYKKALRDQYRQRARSVAPGGSLSWTFPPVDGPRREAPALLRFRFAISELSFEDIRGTWIIRRGSQSRPFEIPHNGSPQRLYSLEIPPDVLRGEGPAIVEYRNEHDRPITVFFDPDEGVALLVPAGGFAANYARALLVILFHLVFLAALGTAMGTLFSMPVAAFAAWSFIFLIAAAGFMENLSVSSVPFGNPESSALAQRILNAALGSLFRAVQAVARPLSGADPLDRLAEGIWVAPGWVARVFLIKVLIYSGLLAGFSFQVFNRRELALPTA